MAAKPSTEQPGRLSRLLALFNGNSTFVVFVLKRIFTMISMSLVVGSVVVASASTELTTWAALVVLSMLPGLQLALLCYAVMRGVFGSRRLLALLFWPLLFFSVACEAVTFVAFVILAVPFTVVQLPYQATAIAADTFNRAMPIDYLRLTSAILLWLLSLQAATFNHGIYRLVVAGPASAAVPIPTSSADEDATSAGADGADGESALAGADAYAAEPAPDAAAPVASSSGASEALLPASSSESSRDASRVVVTLPVDVDDVLCAEEISRSRALPPIITIALKRAANSLVLAQSIVIGVTAGLPQSIAFSAATLVCAIVVLPVVGHGFLLVDYFMWMRRRETCARQSRLNWLGETVSLSATTCVFVGTMSALVVALVAFVYQPLNSSNMGIVISSALQDLSGVLATFPIIAALRAYRIAFVGRARVRSAASELTHGKIAAMFAVSTLDVPLLPSSLRDDDDLEATAAHDASADKQPLPQAGTDDVSAADVQWKLAQHEQQLGGAQQDATGGAAASAAASASITAFPPPPFAGLRPPGGLSWSGVDDTPAPPDAGSPAAGARIAPAAPTLYAPTRTERGGSTRSGSSGAAPASTASTPDKPPGLRGKIAAAVRALSNKINMFRRSPGIMTALGVLAVPLPFLFLVARRRSFAGVYVGMSAWSTVFAVGGVMTSIYAGSQPRGAAQAELALAVALFMMPVCQSILLWCLLNEGEDSSRSRAANALPTTWRDFGIGIACGLLVPFPLTNAASLASQAPLSFQLGLWTGSSLQAQGFLMACVHVACVESSDGVFVNGCSGLAEGPVMGVLLLAGLLVLECGASLMLLRSSIERAEGASTALNSSSENVCCVKDRAGRTVMALLLSAVPVIGGAFGSPLLRRRSFVARALVELLAVALVAGAALGNAAVPSPTVILVALSIVEALVYTYNGLAAVAVVCADATCAQPDASSIEVPSDLCSKSQNVDGTLLGCPGLAGLILCLPTLGLANLVGSGCGCQCARGYNVAFLSALWIAVPAVGSLLAFIAAGALVGSFLAMGTVIVAVFAMFFLVTSALEVTTFWSGCALTNDVVRCRCREGRLAAVRRTSEKPARAVPARVVVPLIPGHSSATNAVAMLSGPAPAAAASGEASRGETEALLGPNEVLWWRRADADRVVLAPVPAPGSAASLLVAAVGIIAFGASQAFVYGSALGNATIAPTVSDLYRAFTIVAPIAGGPLAFVALVYSAIGLRMLGRCSRCVVFVMPAVLVAITVVAPITYYAKQHTTGSS